LPPNSSLCPDADRAAHGVASVHRALRSAQNFDAVEVDELLREEAVGGHLPHAVDVRADGWNSAHAEDRAARTAAAARDDDVRHTRADPLEVVEAAHLEVLTRDRDDRDRHVLQILLAARGRDDDLFESIGAGLLGGRRARRSPNACQCRQYGDVNSMQLHGFPRLM